MATITQQDVAPLHKHLSITIEKEDYLPTFEKTLKEYSKKANIPGFRKGMVPAGLIRKMYGNSLFVDEILRAVDKEVINYIQNEKLDIFAQPLPVEMNLSQLDVNHPNNYTFTFELGMKPDFKLPDLSKENIKKFKVEVASEMIEEELERLRNRYGNMTEPEKITTDENVLNVTFIETDAEGNEIEGGIRKENSLLVKYFKEDFKQQLFGKGKDDIIQLQLKEAFEDKEKQAIIHDLGVDAATDKHFKLMITKVGLVEKRELNEEFFSQLFPDQGIKTEEDFRGKVKEQLQAQWDTESRNQLHHQLYHNLLEHTEINFPQDFLKRWIKTQGENKQEKTDEQVEEEFPTFLNQLKWTLITEKMLDENNIEVQQEDIRQFARQQLLGYMGMQLLDISSTGSEQQWVRDYIDRMMKDKKYVEDAYHRIQTQKMFDWAETQINAEDTSINIEKFIAMQKEHQHQHH